MKRTTRATLCALAIAFLAACDDDHYFSTFTLTWINTDSEADEKAHYLIETRVDVPADIDLEEVYLRAVLELRADAGAFEGTAELRLSEDGTLLVSESLRGEDGFAEEVVYYEALGPGHCDLPEQDMRSCELSFSLEVTANVANELSGTVRFGARGFGEDGAKRTTTQFDVHP